jgi:hypothetical protein
MKVVYCPKDETIRNQSREASEEAIKKTALI